MEPLLAPLALPHVTPPLELPLLASPPELPAPEELSALPSAPEMPLPPAPRSPSEASTPLEMGDDALHAQKTVKSQA
jgi:hypothetical protein